MKKIRKRSPRRASALAFTLVITTFLSVVTALALSLANQEHKLTQRRIVVREANNAAEAAINYGVAQVIQLTSANQFVTSDFLNPKFGHALPSPPPDAAVVAGGLAGISAKRITLLGGMADPPAGSNAFMISTGNPTSSTDSCKGMVVHAKTVPLLASVVVPVPGGDPIQVYAKAHVMIRDAALFNYAMFYGRDTPLGMHPGSPMTITGNIRVNSDIYLGGAGGSITALGTVFSSGDFKYGRAPTDSGTTVWGVNQYFPRVDNNGNGTYDNFTSGSGNYWSYNETSKAMETNKSAFYAPVASTAELVNGQITSAAGVKNNIAANTDWAKLCPDAGDWAHLSATDKAALSKQLWATYSTKLTNGSVQDSASGVLPVVPAGLTETSKGENLIAPPLKSTDSGYNAEVEASKFSNKAGMYIVADQQGKTLAFSKAGDAAEYLAESAGAARDAWVAKPVNQAKVLDLVKEGIVTPPLATVTDTATGVTTNKQAFFDRLQNKAVRAVDVDLGKLRAYVAGKPTFADGTTAYTMNPSPGSPGWNGIVYVQVENPTQVEPVKYNDTAGALTTINSTLTAVRVINAKEVPDRYVTNNGDGTKGFTLATNAPIYTKGSVNADGVTDDTSGSMPDSGNVKKPGNETAVCLAGDAYATLSAAWDDAKSFPGFPLGKVTSDTEISSAIIAGPITAKVGDEAFELPRLCEDWAGYKISVRGSQVALFRAQYAKNGNYVGTVYGVPSKRQFGLSELFRNGIYPPGTPMLRSYRRMSYRIISKAEYDAEKAAVWTQPDGSTLAKFPW